MTKLLERVDSAATRGARKQAAQSHRSMLKGIVVRRTSGITISHVSSTKKGTISIKTRGH